MTRPQVSKLDGLQKCIKHITHSIADKVMGWILLHYRDYYEIQATILSTLSTISLVVLNHSPVGQHDRALASGEVTQGVRTLTFSARRCFFGCSCHNLVNRNHSPFDHITYHWDPIRKQLLALQLQTLRA